LFKKIIAILLIIRPINVIISFLSIFVACLICSDGNIIVNKVLFALPAGAFVVAAGNVINDILDVKIDQVNRPARMLPAGRLKKHEAVVLYIVLNVVAVVSASFLNSAGLIIVIVSVAGLFIYSYYLKSVPLTGNIVVSFLTALTFIFGGAVVGHLQNAIMPALFAFLVNFIREVIKDIEDMEGDKKNRVFTLPGRYGVDVSLVIVRSTTVILLLVTFIPFILHLYRIEYFITIMISVNVLFVYFLKSLWLNSDRKNLGRLSRLLKLNMILGLLAIYIGTMK